MTTLKGKRVLFIGGGNMGGAMVAGLLRAGTVRASQITVTDVRPETLTVLRKRFGVRTTADNAHASSQADVVVLCVKPQQMAEALSQIRGRMKPGTLAVSIAAGVPSRQIGKALGPKIGVIRVMPNTPALLSAGAVAYAPGRGVRKSQEAVARAILEPVGRVWRVPERWMDAVTALSGSGPAYAFFLTECLAEAGRMLGLPRALAEALARQTVYGAGLMLKESPEAPDVLRARVTSPGGTTEAALKVLEKRRVRKIFQDALAAARRRSIQLSQR